MVKLYIEGNQADVTDDFKIAITKQLSDFTSPAVVINTYSNTITLEGTPTNNKIFNQIWLTDKNVTDGGFNPNKRVGFVLLDEKENIFERGYIKLTKIVRKQSTVKYEVVLYGQLGDFFYNLTYNTNGTKKNLASLLYYPFDYPVNTVNGVPNQVDDWSDVQWDARYVWENWRGLKETNGYKIKPKNKFIAAVPTISGYHSNFDNNKVLVNYSGITADNPYSLIRDYLPRVENDGNDVYTLKSGFSLCEFDRGISEVEIESLCAQYMRPAIWLNAVLDACCNPDNNGGYEVTIEDKIKNSPIVRDAFVMFKPFEFEKNEQYENYQQVRGYNVTGVTPTNERIINLGTAYGNYFDCSDMRYPSLYTTWNAGWWVDRSSLVNLESTTTNLYSKDIFFVDKPDGSLPKESRTRTSITYGGIIFELECYDDLGSYGKNYVFVSSDTILDGEYAFSRVISGKNQEYGDYSIAFNNLKAEIKKFMGPEGDITNLNYQTVDFVPIAIIINDTLRELRLDNFEINMNWWHESSPGERAWNIPNNPTELKYKLRYRYIGVTTEIIRRNLGQVEISRTVTPLGQPRLYQEYDGNVYTYVSSVMRLLNINLQSKTTHLTNAVYNTTSDNPNLEEMSTKISKELFFSASSSPLDYLLGLVKMWNLKVLSDPINKKIKIVTAETFYEDKNLIDLSDKIVYNKDITVLPYIYDAANIKVGLETPDTFPFLDDAKNGYPGYTLKSTNRHFNSDTLDLLDGVLYERITSGKIGSKYINSPTPNTQNKYIPMVIKPALIKQTLWSGTDSDKNKTFERSGLFANTHSYNNTRVIYSNHYITTANNKFDEVDDINNSIIYYYGPDEEEVKLYNINHWMMELNGNPCHLYSPASNLDVDATQLVWSADENHPIPYFSDWTVIGSNTTISADFYDWFLLDGPSFYNLFWKNYLTQLCSENAKTVTLYTFIPPNLGLEELFKKFYFFENTTWVLNKIENYTFSGAVPYKCTFIRVQDKNNFGVIPISIN